MAKGTTHSSNLRVGRVATSTVGAVKLSQLYKVVAFPLSGTNAFVLPASSRIVGFQVYQTSAFTGEATVRFGAVGGNGSNLYGQAPVSATNVTVIITPGTNASVWEIGASSQPIGISVVSASGGPSTQLAGNVRAVCEYFIEGDSEFAIGDY